jgi:hypothetical protein
VLMIQKGVVEVEIDELNGVHRGRGG